jgi:thiamine-monophosphate kinase
MGEFDLIERFFKARFALDRQDLALGIGDDCALMTVAPGHQLAVSSDVMVEGTHFLSGVEPRTLGHKCLAVNLSDLAACGAKPKAFTLSLTLPRIEEAWLGAFSEGLHALSTLHACALIGGDTTQGPLNIGITVFGEVPKGQALLRSGAQAGDDLYVSGTLGDARWALLCLQGQMPVQAARLKTIRTRLEMPTPRLELGLALRGIASAAIDLSDGLLGDLGHVLKASQKGAQLRVLEMAQSALVSKALSTLPKAQALTLMLQGGDDYELLFTAPPSKRLALQALAQALKVPLTVIGQVTENAGTQLHGAEGLLDAQALKKLSSFEHFYD